MKMKTGFLFCLIASHDLFCLLQMCNLSAFFFCGFRRYTRSIITILGQIVMKWTYFEGSSPQYGNLPDCCGLIRGLLQSWAHYVHTLDSGEA